MLTPALPQRLARLSIVAALSHLGLFFLLALTQLAAVAASAPTAVGPANSRRLLASETCFATPNNGATVYSSTTAQAVRDAVAAAPAGGSVKVAGYCAGVSGGNLVIVNVALTLSGGYTVTDWAQSNPLTNPTTLDALGGGRVLRANMAITLTDLIIQRGSSPTTAGGAWFDGPAILSGTTFISNTVIGGGGGGARFFSMATLTNTTFINNTADGFGGGAEFNGPAILSDTTFISNTAGASGGGAYFASLAILPSSVFISNTASLGGGAYFASTSQLATLNNVLFTNNRTTPGSGGGAYFGGPAQLVGPTFTNNRATASGGGGAYFGGAATLTGTAFISNVANSQGGGAAFNNTATLTNATFTDNAAAFGGGASFMGASFKQLTNPLFNRNRATSQGAALYVANANPLNLRHATLVSPTLVSGTAIYVVTGTVNITNTLIASHTVGLTRAGGTVNEDYNLFAAVAAPYGGTILSGANSLTGTAGFYNTTAYTLTPNSSALDHGTNLSITTDYFGNPRPQGLASDIGYAESPYTYTLLYTFTAQPAHLFANGLDVALLTFTATNASGSGADFYGRPLTLTTNSLGTLATTNLILNTNGVATTTFTAGFISGTAPLTATLFALNVTNVVTLKPNPLIGSLWAQFGGNIITYTFVVTNVDVLTQTVMISGSVPVGGNVITATGSSVPTGGDYGWGYVAASGLDLAPNASHTLQWVVQLNGAAGAVEAQGHAESLQARMRLDLLTLLSVYRQFVLPVWKP